MHISIRRLMLMTVAVAVMMPFPAMAQQMPAPAAAVDRGLPDFLSRWFPQFFGAPDEGPRPEDTLQAPFVDPGAVQREQSTAAAMERSGVIFMSTDGNKYRTVTDESGKTFDMPVYNPSNGVVDEDVLSISHRRPEHLAIWLTSATSEILTTDSPGYQAHLKHLSTGMSDVAMAEYQKFMQDTGLLERLRSQDVKLAGYVDEPPLLLNEGPLNGRYRWLFEMPVTVTLLPRNARNYKDISRPQDSTLRFIVQTQLGRVEKGPSDDNVFIETWRVRAAPAPAARKAAP